jgi:protein-arginine kinase activator protein McsA
MGRDEEAERAVERWVRVGDEVVVGKVGKTGGEREDQATRACASCGTTFHILASDDRVFCARCFLERGPNRTIE